MAKQLPRACKRTLAACGVKRCSKCQAIQPTSSFHKRAASWDGLQAKCRSCMARANQEFRERRPEYLREWTQQNPDYLKNWRQSEQGKAAGRKARRKRRAMKAQVQEDFSAEDERFVFERDGYRCVDCGMTNDEHLERWNQRLHLDHIKPLSKGYALTRENAQLLCRKCNSSKRDKIG